VDCTLLPVAESVLSVVPPTSNASRALPQGA
jgi:hypothetical protein